MNTVRPLHSDVSDEEIPLHLSLVLLRGTFELAHPSMNGATCVDFGVVTPVQECEGPAHKVGDSITDIIMIRRDKATLLAVEGVSDATLRATSIAMVQ